MSSKEELHQQCWRDWPTAIVLARILLFVFNYWGFWFTPCNSLFSIYFCGVFTRFWGFSKSSIINWDTTEYFRIYLELNGQSLQKTFRFEGENVKSMEKNEYRNTCFWSIIKIQYQKRQDHIGFWLWFRHLYDSRCENSWRRRKSICLRQRQEKGKVLNFRKRV
jgi:hypothetical protein